MPVADEVPGLAVTVIVPRRVIGACGVGGLDVVDVERMLPPSWLRGQHTRLPRRGKRKRKRHTPPLDIVEGLWISHAPAQAIKMVPFVSGIALPECECAVAVARKRVPPRNP
jgi:hypothetical protein